MTSPLDAIPREAFTASDRGKFQAKLNFTERCTVLALAKSGVSRAVIAEAFSIDRRTVTHICNDNSVHYRDIRSRLRDLGIDEFVKQHISEADATRIGAAVQRIRAATPTPRPVASPRATGSSGIHTVKPPQCDYSHRLEIAWRDTGWYYRDLDSKSDPDAWLHNGPESMMTSSACLKAAEDNLTDD